ncbi:hypothetical protein QI305_12280 [Staphylococcus saprophyticus]|nr:hypothetical protein [Staphylococcus saprophyticus]
MKMKDFKAHGKNYKFEYRINYWGETELVLFENGKDVGLLNANYTIDEGEKIVKDNENFKNSEAIIK